MYNTNYQPHPPIKRYPSSTPSRVTFVPLLTSLTTALESAGGVVVRHVKVSLATDTTVHGVPSMSTATRAGSVPKLSYFGTMVAQCMHIWEVWIT